MRTTLDLDAPVLRELKRLQKLEGQSLGRLASDLLARALGERKAGRSTPLPFRWTSRRMGALVDLGDKDAVHGVLDREAEVTQLPTARP